MQNSEISKYTPSDYKKSNKWWGIRVLILNIRVDVTERLHVFSKIGNRFEVITLELLVFGQISYS